MLLSLTCIFAPSLISLRKGRIRRCYLLPTMVGCLLPTSSPIPLLLFAVWLSFERAAQPFLLLFKVKVLAGAALENVEHIQTGGLKVCGCIVRLRDEHLGLQTFVGRFVVIRDGLLELLCDRPEQIQTGFNLLCSSSPPWCIP